MIFKLNENMPSITNNLSNVMSQHIAERMLRASCRQMLASWNCRVTDASALYKSSKKGKNYIVSWGTTNPAC